MLVDETRRVVHFVVDHEVEVLLGGVLRDVGVGEFLVGHFAVVSHYPSSVLGRKGRSVESSDRP